MGINDSKREHLHIQTAKSNYHSVPYAPNLKTGSGKGRFGVEDEVYVSGLGYDVVDPMNSGNEHMVGFWNYVKMKELLGYEHVGKSSSEIKQTLDNLWGEGWDD